MTSSYPLAKGAHIYMISNQLPDPEIIPEVASFLPIPRITGA